MSEVNRREFFSFAGSMAAALASTSGTTLATDIRASEVRITGEANPNLASFDRLMTQFVATNKVPGASLAVARGDRVVYSRGFGYANIRNRKPVEPDALFRIASLSKPITAVAVLKLVERGRLKLDDQVAAYLRMKPFLPAGRKLDRRWADITVRHLLQHTGGWDREKSKFSPTVRHTGKIAAEMKLPPPPKPVDVVRYMLGQPLDFSPGERYAYSNFGYCVLGRVIETVTGQPYEAYVKREILRPLGIRRMQIGKTLPSQRANGEVTYYDERQATGAAMFGPQRGRQVPRPYGTWYLEGMDAHGGWIASAVDLVRFAADLQAGHSLLSSKSLQTMLTPPQGKPGHHEDGTPKQRYYGCGWSVVRLGDRRQNYYHLGSLSGTATILVCRHDGLSWAVLFNTRNNPDGKHLGSAIDSQVHRAANAVKRWPG